MLKLRHRRNYARAVARVERMSNARLLLTFLALFAFTCQTYVTHTHIHFPRASDNLATTDVGSKAPLGKQDGKEPFRPNQDPVNCPICQELVHAGATVMPAAIPILPALPVFSLVAIAETALHFQSPSHNWQGRAPPRS